MPLVTRCFCKCHMLYLQPKQSDITARVKTVHRRVKFWKVGHFAAHTAQPCSSGKICAVATCILAGPHSMKLASLRSLMRCRLLCTCVGSTSPCSTPPAGSSGPTHADHYDLQALLLETCSWKNVGPQSSYSYRKLLKTVHTHTHTCTHTCGQKTVQQVAPALVPSYTANGRSAKKVDVLMQSSSTQT